MTIKPLRWWQRFQIQIEARWTLFPDKDSSWRQWLISPEAHWVQPGQEVNPRQDWPGGGIPTYGQLRIIDSPIDPETRLRKSRYFARYFWASFFLRVLGLDAGAGIMWLAKVSPPAEPPS